MSSIIKVNTYQDANGNALFSSDGSGNVTLTNFPDNTPAFHFQNNTNQSIPDVSNTKVTFTTERYNTGNGYDSSTSKFTPNVAGKYFIYAQLNMDINTGVGQIGVKLYVNGTNTDLSRQAHYYGNNQQSYKLETTVELNGSTDYVEIYVYQDSGSTRTLASGGAQTFFGGYKLIGA